MNNWQAHMQNPLYVRGTYSLKVDFFNKILIYFADNFDIIQQK